MLVRSKALQTLTNKVTTRTQVTYEYLYFCEHGSWSIQVAFYIPAKRIKIYMLVN